MAIQLSLTTNLSFDVRGLEAGEVFSYTFEFTPDDHPDDPAYKLYNGGTQKAKAVPEALKGTAHVETSWEELTVGSGKPGTVRAWLRPPNTNANTPPPDDQIIETHVP